MGRVRVDTEEYAGGDPGRADHSTDRSGSFAAAGISHVSSPPESTAPTECWSWGSWRRDSACP